MHTHELCKYIARACPYPAVFWEALLESTQNKHSSVVHVAWKSYHGIDRLSAWHEILEEVSTLYFRARQNC